LSVGLVSHLAAGGGVGFVTATIPHNQGDSLSGLFSGVTDAWSNVRRDHRVREWFGDHHVGFVRSAEVTHGDNGWHPHNHVGIVTDTPFTRDDARELHKVMFEPWCRGCEANGWRAPSPKYGLSVIRCDAGIAGYVSKVEGLADELTRLDSKSARKTEPPFSILRRAVAGDREAAGLWIEYERGTKGRRALCWSVGLRDRLGLGVEASDLELAEPDRGGYVELGRLSRQLADVLALHPEGFELFAEAVVAGTPEAWDSAVMMLRGTAPWWVRAEVEYLHTGLLLPPDRPVVVRESVSAGFVQEGLF
jgi:hypothetical protein